MFVSVGDVVKVKKFDSNTKEEDASLWDDMKKTEILVLDDLGMEKPTDRLKE